MRRILLFALTLVFPSLLFSQQTPPAVNLSNSGSYSYDVSVAVNGQGNIGTVWVEEYSPGNKQLFFSMRNQGKWSSPMTIPGQSANNKRPSLSRGRSGSGFCCVWHDEANNVIQYCEWTGTSWIAPIPISDPGRSQTNLFGEPKVAMSGAGRIVAVWNDATPTSIYSDIYARVWNGSWGEITNISETSLVSKISDIYVGPDNRVYVVWQDNYWEDPVDMFDVNMNVLNTSGRWEGAERITNYRQWFFKPCIAVNGAKSIMINFYFMQMASYHAIFYINGRWTAPIICSDVGDHHDHDQYWTDACAYGNGFIFIYRDISYQVVYKLASKGDFGPANLLSKGGNCYKPCITYNTAVGAVACWSEDGEVYASVFKPGQVPPEPPIPPGPGPGPNPPSGNPVFPPVDVIAESMRIDYSVPKIKVDLIENRNVFSIQYVNRVSWDPSTVPSQFDTVLTGYKIFRRVTGESQWILAGLVEADTLEYADKNQIDAGVRYEYLVLGVDDTGSTAFVYNCLSWKNNPKNVETGATVARYHIYRMIPGLYDFGGWRDVDGNVLSFEDRSPEIRAGTNFEYGVSAIDFQGRETSITPATKANQISRGLVLPIQTRRDRHHCPGCGK